MCIPGTTLGATHHTKAVKPSDAPSEIQSVLEREADWVFNVIELERLSNKR